MKLVLTYCLIILVLFIISSCTYFPSGDFNSTYYGAIVKGKIINNNSLPLDGVQILANKKPNENNNCLLLNSFNDTTLSNTKGNFEFVVGSNALLNCLEYKVVDSLGKSFIDTVSFEFSQSGNKILKKVYIIKFRFADFTLRTHKFSDFEKIKWEENDLGTIILDYLENDNDLQTHIK